MEASTQIRLTEFATSLISRSRATTTTEANAPLLVPIAQDPESLKAALVAQADRMKSLQASFSAQVDALLVTTERLEVELALLRGELERVSADRAAQSVEMSRIRIDTRELADQMVARLIEQFEQRVKSLR